MSILRRASLGTAVFVAFAALASIERHYFDLAEVSAFFCGLLIAIGLP